MSVRTASRKKKNVKVDTPLDLSQIYELSTAIISYNVKEVKAGRQDQYVHALAYALTLVQIAIKTEMRQKGRKITLRDHKQEFFAQKFIDAFNTHAEGVVLLPEDMRNSVDAMLRAEKLPAKRPIVDNFWPFFKKSVK